MRTSAQVIRDVERLVKAMDGVVLEWRAYLKRNSDWEVTRAGGTLKALRDAVERYEVIRGDNIKESP